MTTAKAACQRAILAYIISMNDIITFLKTRRSVKAKELKAPGPSKEELRQICEIGMRVPDHGKLAPYQIKVLREPGQKALGALCADIFMRENPKDAKQKHWDHEAERFARAPLVLAVLYTPKLGKIPPWEQELAVGAVCMNLLHAAHAMGFAGQWLTEWPAYKDEVRDALGGVADDRIAGFLYMGTPDDTPEDRKRPDYDEQVSVWEG